MKRVFAPYTWCEDYPTSILHKPGCFAEGEDFIVDQAAELGVDLKPTDSVFRTSVRVGDVFGFHAIPLLNPVTRQYAYLVGIFGQNNSRIEKAVFIEEGRVGWELVKFLQDKRISLDEQKQVQAVLNTVVDQIGVKP